MKLIDYQIRDIYKLDEKITRIWDQIKVKLSSENIELFEKYETELINLGLAKATRIKQLQILLIITKKINKNWVCVTKSDIDGLVREIANEYSDVNGDETETSRDFKKILKLFYRWFKLGSRDYKQVGDPPETKGIRLKRPKDKITRENLLKEEDRAKLLHACGENLRDRAFIDVHLEAGTRPGEILSLQLKHIEFDKIGARIHVDGKTGARPIRLIRSVPNLAAWINAHPFGNKLDFPLWILLDSKNYGKPMTYAATTIMIAKRCKIANISKRVNLKLFRHSAATNMSKILTDAEMKKRHGWARASNMPARYVHLVDSDVEEKILTYYGLRKEEQSEENHPKICYICKTINSQESQICSKCGKPLSIEVALEYEKQQKEFTEKFIEQIVLQIMNNNTINNLKIT